MQELSAWGLRLWALVDLNNFLLMLSKDIWDRDKTATLFVRAYSAVDKWIFYVRLLVILTLQVRITQRGQESKHLLKTAFEEPANVFGLRTY